MAGTNRALAAGIAAGKVWATTDAIAADERHALTIARLRSWCSGLIESEDWDYRFVYASLLTSKLVIDNTGKSGDDELFLAAEEASYEALDFWRSFPSWPDDQNERWSFVEGFVRGAATDELVSRSMKTLAVTAMLSILDDTAALAQRVVDGELTGSGASRAPDSMMEVHRDARKAKCVDDVVSLGAMLIARWCMQHKGPGAVEWPDMLQSWLDRWENDFLVSLGGDERAGYSQLLDILRPLRRAVEQSPRVQ
jgi:hypothetical protein